MANKLEGKLIAAVRVRGTVNVRGNITETLKRLNLKRVNNCALIKVTDSYRGMINKCNGYIAYGEINEDVLGKMLKKADLKVAAKDLIDGKVDVKTLADQMPFRLHPPRHGYGGTKLGFNQGGVLGYQGEKINRLLIRMV
jgi:large subunit ribosomal protein L30